LNAIKREMGNQDFGNFGALYRLSTTTVSGENCVMNSDKILRGLEKAGVAKARRHLFLCIGPECCPTQEGEMLWDRIKDRVRQSGLEVMRTKAACFRICTGGPWLAVYPDGVWYGEVTPERFERIWGEHICEDKPVREWIGAVSPLRGCGLPAQCSEKAPGPTE
jgi:(2Fe-2S) ferredoxin